MNKYEQKYENKVHASCNAHRAYYGIQAIITANPCQTESKLWL